MVNLVLIAFSTISVLYWALAWWKKKYCMDTWSTSFLGPSRREPWERGWRPDQDSADISIRIFSVMLSSPSDVVTRHYYLDLSDKREEIFHEILRRKIQVYTKYRRVSTPNGVSAFIEHIQDVYNLAYNLCASDLSYILPPLHNRTHKTTLGGMGASVSQADETLY